MSEDDAIRVEVEDGVKIVTLHTPERKNALSPDGALRMARELEAGAEDGTRVVVITGAGGAFCAGADLKGQGFAKAREEGVPLEEQIREMVDATYHRLARAVVDLPRPVIAAVDGVAAGFGCSLALLADLTLASTRARFIQVFVNIALIPDGGSTYILPRLVGMKKAMEMIFTGDPVSAEEALELKMINRVCAPDELLEQSRAWARRLAEGPVRTMGVAKKTLHEAQHLPWREVLDLECGRQAALMTRPDFLRAVEAFVLKRKPTFS